MKRFKKKGFTLIELMIVLAIIAILAIVLIPKAGALKSGARDAGVSTNVNSVRALLEKRYDNDVAAASANPVADLTTGLTSNFNNDNLTNPDSKGTSITSTAPTASPAPAIYVSNGAATITTNLYGTVIVEVSGSGSTLSYKIYGVDSSGTVIGSPYTLK